MDVFTAIADPVRRRLLRQLARGSARVVDLASAHDISRPAVSRHLRVLTEAGLVEADPVGRERHYRSRPEPLEDVRALLDDLDPVAVRAPIRSEALDALELEVRRVGRERRTGTATTAATTATSTEETA